MNGMGHADEAIILIKDSDSVWEQGCDHDGRTLNTRRLDPSVQSPIVWSEGVIGRIDGVKFAAKFRVDTLIFISTLPNSIDSEPIHTVDMMVEAGELFPRRESHSNDDGVVIVIKFGFGILDFGILLVEDETYGIQGLVDKDVIILLGVSSLFLVLKDEFGSIHVAPGCRNERNPATGLAIVVFHPIDDEEFGFPGLHGGFGHDVFSLLFCLSPCS